MKYDPRIRTVYLIKVKKIFLSKKANPIWKITAPFDAMTKTLYTRKDMVKELKRLVNRAQKYIHPFEQ
jgi:hypothetical protein